MIKLASAVVLAWFSLFTAAATPTPYILQENSSHSVAANSPVVLAAQVPNTVRFRMFIDGVKICDILESRPFYACNYQTSSTAGTYEVEVRTNQSVTVGPNSPNQSFFSDLVVGTPPAPILLVPDSTHNIEAGAQVLLAAQVPNTAWLRIFVDGVRICDIREPRIVYVCSFETPSSAGVHNVEVRTNSSLVVTTDSPNRSYFSTLVVGGVSNAINLTPDSTHNIEPNSQVTFVAAVPNTAWFRLFVNGVKICDIRQSQSTYSCAYETSANAGINEVEVRTNASLVVSPSSPNRSFYSTVVVAGTEGTIFLEPNTTHGVDANSQVTFVAVVPGIAWFRLFINGVKICDIRQSQPSYSCDYFVPPGAAHYNIEVRSNMSLQVSESSPNMSFYSTAVVVQPGYALHFSEEFRDVHGGKPDPASWDYNTGTVINNERQCYTDAHPSYVDAGVSNVRVETRNFEESGNGYLVLQLKRENVACRQADGEIFNYTSGAIATRVDGIGTPYLVEMPFGIYEVRAKIPSGRGTWPAVWLLGKKDYSPEEPTNIGWPDSGEIDIMEAVGFEEANGLYRTHHTLHRNRDEGFLWPHQRPNETGQGMTYPLTEQPSANFHVYKIIWKPESIEYFVDNVRVTKMHLGHGATDDREGFFRSAPDMNGWGHPNTTADDHLGWPFAMEANNEFKLILNLAFGGNWGGQQGLDNSIFANGRSVEMLVDYVRIYVED